MAAICGDTESVMRLPAIRIEASACSNMAAASSSRSTGGKAVRAARGRLDCPERVQGRARTLFPPGPDCRAARGSRRSSGMGRQPSRRRPTTGHTGTPQDQACPGARLHRRARRLRRPRQLEIRLHARRRLPRVELAGGLLVPARGVRHHGRRLPGAAGEHDKWNHDQQSDGVHFLQVPILSPRKRNTSTMRTTAGPIATTKKDGNRQKTSGNTSLVPIFAASSSARCMRLSRNSSA